jgi:hypothetical protein
LNDFPQPEAQISDFLFIDAHRRGIKLFINFRTGLCSSSLAFRISFGALVLLGA